MLQLEVQLLLDSLSNSTSLDLFSWFAKLLASLTKHKLLAKPVWLVPFFSPTLLSNGVHPFRSVWTCPYDCLNYGVLLKEKQMTQPIDYVPLSVDYPFYVQKKRDRSLAFSFTISLQ